MRVIKDSPRQWHSSLKKNRHEILLGKCDKVAFHSHIDIWREAICYTYTVKKALYHLSWQSALVHTGKRVLYHLSWQSACVHTGKRVLYHLSWQSARVHTGKRVLYHLSWQSARVREYCTTRYEADPWQCALVHTGKRVLYHSL